MPSYTSNQQEWAIKFVIFLPKWPSIMNDMKVIKKGRGGGTKCDLESNGNTYNNSNVEMLFKHFT